MNLKGNKKVAIVVTTGMACSLSINIPKHEGNKVVKEVLYNQTGKPIATEVIIKLLFSILTLKNFAFNENNYLQRKRCAIGTICASSYVNIF